MKGKEINRKGLKITLITKIKERNDSTKTCGGKLLVPRPLSAMNLKKIFLLPGAYFFKNPCFGG